MQKTVYIILKAGKPEAGDFVLATVERVFQHRAVAEDFIKNSKTIWEEVVQGVTCICERSVIEAIVE